MWGWQLLRYSATVKVDTGRASRSYGEQVEPVQTTHRKRMEMSLTFHRYVWSWIVQSKGDPWLKHFNIIVGHDTCISLAFRCTWDGFHRDLGESLAPAAHFAPLPSGLRTLVQAHRVDSQFTMTTWSCSDLCLRPKAAWLADADMAVQRWWCLSVRWPEAMQLMPMGARAERSLPLTACEQSTKLSRRLSSK